VNAILLLGLLVTADKPKETPKAAPKIEGTWLVVSAVQDGKDEEKAKDSKLTFKDGKITVQKEGDNDKNATYKLGTADKLKTIDVSPEGKDESIKGIYKLDGDKLTICITHKPDGDRPTEFTGKEGSGQMLLELKREKK